jgi:hypothetical protein
MDPIGTSLDQAQKQGMLQRLGGLAVQARATRCQQNMLLRPDSIGEKESALDIAFPFDVA